MLRRRRQTGENKQKMEVPIEQQAPPQQQDVDTSSLTPEQQEEMKLRMKYPNPHKPGGSTFIQKMLHRGVSLYISLIYISNFSAF